MSDAVSQSSNQVVKPLIYCGTALVAVGMLSFSPLAQALVAQPSSQQQAELNPSAPAYPPRPGYAPLPQPGYAQHQPYQPAPQAPAATYPAQPAGLVTGGQADVPLDMLVGAETAGQVIDILEGHTGFDVAAENTNASGKPIYAIFDPQCPHCHAAYREIARDVPIRWLPVALVGDPDKGRRIISEIMAAVADDPSATREQLDEAFADRLGGTEGIDPAAEEVHAANVSLLVTLAEAMQAPAGVPLFAVPRPDGSVAFHSGFGAGDGAEIVGVYRGGTDAE